MNKVKWLDVAMVLGWCVNINFWVKPEWFMRTGVWTSKSKDSPPETHRKRLPPKMSFLALYEMSASSVSPLGGGHLRSINQRWQKAKSRIDVWRWKWKYLWLVFPWHGHLTNVTILKVSVGKLFRKFSLVISIHSHSQFNPNSLLASTDLAALGIYAMYHPQQNLKNQWTCIQMQLNVKCMYSIWWNHVWCSLFSISKLHPNHYTPSLELPLHVPVANIFVVSM